MNTTQPSAAAAANTGAAAAATNIGAAAILELRVRNHPGVMSHLTGLFARRAFNLEAILCAPVGDGRESRMLLLVADTPRLEQIERQAAKLHDVLAIRHRPDLAPSVFAMPPGAECDCER
ncbi:MAG: ACT domain-containing protein [Opitutaceae bacterium]|jgi:acetolactate synthase-1/3 small subunit|nr:ACT domain-containing protein [Opitutaceae bacterium]